MDSFIWVAVLKDKSEIYQFPADKTEETLFKEIIKNNGNLLYFELFHLSTKQYFQVNLIDGTININKHEEITDRINEDKKNIRIIYFRHRDIDSANILTTTYYLGIQYLNKLGNNERIILKINENGSFSRGDDVKVPKILLED